ncbi:MAG: hypothetical protein Q7R70_06915 [Candidatus Diapherotrites archaeon]|nr:hypothetical protein [Candidatus Diapherotrites archaeon]
MQFFVSVGSKRNSQTFAKFEAKNFRDALKQVTWKQVLVCKNAYENDGGKADSVEVTSPSDKKYFTMEEAKKIIG